MLIDITALLSPAIALAITSLPVLLAVGVVLYLKRAEARDQLRSPINEKLLHQPGTHARRKAEEIDDEILARTSVLFLIGPLGMMALLLPRVQWHLLQFGWTDWVAIGVALSGVFWCIRGIVQFRRERRNWLNGMHGEMASAQWLDRLRADGCEVFHDLPGDRGNIDHVVVSQTAIFAIETKWRSKRVKGTADVWFRKLP